MRVSTEQEQITVTVIKIDGKKLSFTQLQRLPIIFGECWLDRYLDNSLVPVGKIPVDLAKSIFRKKLETDRTFHNIDYGLLVNFDNQLFLTLVPYSEEEFLSLHFERNTLKKKLEPHRYRSSKIELPLGPSRSNQTPVSKKQPLSESEVAALEAAQHELEIRIMAIKDEFDCTPYIFI